LRQWLCATVYSHGSGAANGISPNRRPGNLESGGHQIVGVARGHAPVECVASDGGVGRLEQRSKLRVGVHAHPIYVRSALFVTARARPTSLCRTTTRLQVTIARPRPDHGLSTEHPVGILSLMAARVADPGGDLGGRACPLLRVTAPVVPESTTNSCPSDGGSRDSTSCVGCDVPRGGVSTSAYLAFEWGELVLLRGGTPEFGAVGRSRK
jgi:hypothetical protein